MNMIVVFASFCKISFCVVLINLCNTDLDQYHVRGGDFPAARVNSILIKHTFSIMPLSDYMQKSIQHG